MGSISCSRSKKHLVVLTAVVALSLLAGTSEAQTGERVQVTIKNNLGQDAWIHCYSNDDDDRPGQVVPTGASYEFRFAMNVRTPTRLFYCDFRWPNNTHDKFIIYYQARDDCAVCQWYLSLFGPCQLNPSTGVHCFDWGPPSQ